MARCISAYSRVVDSEVEYLGCPVLPSVEPRLFTMTDLFRCAGAA